MECWDVHKNYFSIFFDILKYAVKQLAHMYLKVKLDFRH
jgi:hypothetical protein